MRLFGGKNLRRSQRAQRQNKATWNKFNRNLAAWNASDSDKIKKSVNNATRQQPTSNLGQRLAPQPASENERDFVFRRNATMSNMQRESREKSERQKIRDMHLRRRQIKLIAIALLVAGVLVVLVGSQFSGNFVTVSSSVPSLTSAGASRYSSLVSQYLAQHPFERFSFSRRDTALTEFIQTKAPEVASANLAPLGLGSGRLSLTFRRPVAMWASVGATYFVDSVGVVFSKNYFVNPSVTITDDSGAAVTNGQVTSSGFLSFIGQVEAKLAKNSLTLQRVVIPRGAIRCADLYLQGRSYPFLAQIDRDAASQAADILASVNYFDANKILPQYVDVRVASKMYWK